MKLTPGSPAPTRQWWRLTRLARKEVSEILRDRRTVITLVLMPLLLYPVMSLAFRQYFLAARADLVDEDVGGPALTVAFANADSEGGFAALLHFTNDILRRQRPNRKPSEVPRILKVPLDDDLAKTVRDHKAQLGVRLKNVQDFKPSQDLRWDYELIYLETSAPSREALRFAEERIALANSRYLLSRLKISGAAPPVNAVTFSRQALAASEEGQEFSYLAALVPLILILMTITGAVYPAIDLTAGERERGTLELLCAAPVPRVGLLFSKYVAVVIVAVLTAVVNLAAMTATLSVTGLWSAILKNVTLTPGLVLEIFLLLLLFACFFSAVLLCLTSFARSFKEAQAYLIPLMLVSLAPGVMALMPGIKLNGLLAVAPLINIVLLARDLFDGQAQGPLATLVVTSTLVYAAAAITVAARLFGAEAVLYSEQGSWGDLLRRPANPRAEPSAGGALFCLAMIFLVGFLVGNSVALNQALSILERFYLMAGLTVVLFVGLPVAGAAYARVRPASGFRLRVGPWAGYAGALLLGLSAWVFVTELTILLYRQEIVAFDPARALALRGFFATLRRSLPVAAVAGLFAAQGVAEEVFFRGYLFSAVRGRTNATNTVLITALLFGLFHLVGLEGFSLERGLSSTLMGLLLGWVAWRTGSVWPGMLLHGCHNALLILLTYDQSNAQAGGDPQIPAHHPEWMIYSAAVAVLVGLVLIQRFCKPAEPSRVVE
jgi:ABC-2 type transport system permease protein/sodium transport system permease protein